MKLQGKTAIITGAAKGIGAAAARRFAAEGARIVLADKDEANGHEVAKAIVKEGGQAAFCLCDVGNEADVQAALDTAARTYGKLDIVVNNAGILPKSRVFDVTEEDFDRTMAINAKGPFFMIQQAFPYLKESQHARVINIGSLAGRMGGFETCMAYSASGFGD